MLIVDDDADMRSMYAWCLRASGWVVGEADNGLEAFDAVCAFGPDAVVMDVRLPHVDGLQVVRRVKADPETAGIPVVVCTGARGSELEEEARRSGCEVFIRKPVMPDELRDLLESLVADRAPT